MKKIIYKKKATTFETVFTMKEDGTEGPTTLEKETLIEVELPYSDENAALAKLEAYGDEPEVFDDGEPEPAPSSEDRIAELEAALELLLSGAVE